MGKSQENKFRTGATGRNLPDDRLNLSHQIMMLGHKRDSLSTFLPDVLKLFLEYSGCDEIELELAEGERQSKWRGFRRDRKFFHCEAFSAHSSRSPGDLENKGLIRLRRSVFQGRVDPSMPFFTSMGTFWTGDAENLPAFRPGPRESLRDHAIRLEGEWKSLVIMPIKMAKEIVGVLQLASKSKNACTRDEIEVYESVNQTLGMLLANQQARAALGERLKELTCLYGITKLVEESGRKKEKTLQGIAELLPPAWQYPDIASARIELDGRAYVTDGFRSDADKISAEIVIDGRRRGVVEVVYTKKMPELDRGPFMKEERSLIDAVARQIGSIMERRKAEEDKVSLQNQLRHADRLATIGQLAAGVAHELNEPLSNILGFAQLAQKNPDLPDQVGQDIEKIIGASLHSREIVKKLLTYGKPIPPKMTRLQLNKVVEDTLYLFESRCAKSGVEIVRLLDEDLPEITADQVQMNQVLVNLLANAVQAMPGGGRLTIQTARVPEGILLAVEDTGHGMEEDVLQDIFEPFFTTKKRDEGTGLGLSVVRDIIKSHGGSIHVESRFGDGARFDILLPLENQLEEDSDEVGG